MGDISRRIARLEEHFGGAECVCSGAKRESVCIIVERDWGPDRIQAAEAAAQFTCPTHGLQIPNLIRLSPVDAHL